MKATAATWALIIASAAFFCTHFFLYAIKTGKLQPVQILPTLLIAIDFVAAIIYATHLDIRKTIYWIAAAVLTLTVTF